MFDFRLLFVEYVFVLHGSFQKMPLIDWFRYMNITGNKVSVHYIFELIAGVLDLGLYLLCFVRSVFCVASCTCDFVLYAFSICVCVVSLSCVSTYMRPESTAPDSGKPLRTQINKKHINNKRTEKKHKKYIISLLLNMSHMIRFEDIRSPPPCRHRVAS